jgi:hypothetical protein
MTAKEDETALGAFMHLESTIQNKDFQMSVLPEPSSGQRVN